MPPKKRKSVQINASLHARLVKAAADRKDGCRIGHLLEMGATMWLEQWERKAKR